MMPCQNCKRTIKAIESINGITGEVSANFCAGCGATMLGTNYEQSNTSCLQLCQSLFGDEWRVMIEATPVLLAWYASEISEVEAEIVIGYPFEPLFRKAITAGVKLARGEE